ncbi:MAG: hypothetical protein A4E35_01739 [Methanoregula sp. PtaU1.Bin051]|nr:MAG: hypothetical protein A4E35_01739 [Methanoregula sp. PtaU1.Bin051]
MIYGKYFIILAVLCACVINPATAGTKYMSGSPEISVYISGTNEFSPGDDITIPVVIENSGLNEFKFSQSSIVDRDDLPNTAKLMLVSLTAGDAPLTIKSDPQMIGDVLGGSTIITSFEAKVSRDAASGTYLLPVFLNYTYLDIAEQYGTDSIRYYYKNKEVTLSLPIKIKPQLSIDVVSAETEHLNVGTEGYLKLMIRNSGYDDGKRAVIKIIRNGGSPIIPTDSSVFIGDFPSGATAECRYKVSVDPKAERSTYPIDVVVVYENNEGDTVTSPSETVGIPVGGKIDFAIISSPVKIHPGEKKVIAIEYKNIGDTKVYSAQGRISAVDPFTSNDDIAYLGDMDAGESVIASYEVSVDRSATIKEYGLDSEIRYRDALDNSYISDTMKARVDITEQAGVAAILANPIVLSVLIAGIIGIAYGIFRFTRKGE